MKVVTFERKGARSYGILEDDRVLDVGSQLASRYGDLRSVLTAGALRELQSAGAQGVPTFRVDEVNFEPVIPNPEKILCVGLNYISHRTETKRPETKYPSIFTRFADTQVGHETPVLRPSFSTAFDYEGELAVIIGRGGRFISEQDVGAHIAGYSCYNDVSVRDWQRHTAQWTPGKNFPNTGAFGPSLVTPDEIPGPRRSYFENPPQWQSHAGGADLRFDLLCSCDCFLHLTIHSVIPWRRHRNRNAGRSWRPSRPSGLYEGRRHGRNRDRPHRHSSQHRSVRRPRGILS